ncbi:BTB/POZ domain-containing protein [Acorus gramineus]|uniref:BTB/POZ domain-containing protein n=1 Tax=Acorus gramineus TaxID=55184 RepID=A0AAV9BHD3_ACOGR|nr:BTB/POZ domain-containing protein [Acorus gramineus]
MQSGALKKRQRLGSSTNLTRISSSNLSLPSSPPSDDPPLSSALLRPGGFNDFSSSDVLLRLQLHPSLSPPPPIDLYLHSPPLRRSRYFSALLSDRWSKGTFSSGGGDSLLLNLNVPAFDAHVSVLRLLYSPDFSGAIASPSDALSLLSVALELLFDDLIGACVRYLEAVPWTEEEERAVLSAVPFLSPDESAVLLARLTPDGADDAAEEMLQGLVHAAIGGTEPKVATVKAFVARVLRDFSPRDTVRRVLVRVFVSSLAKVKELLEAYWRPDVRGDRDELEAKQRLNLHSAVAKGRHLLWVVERMVELGVAEEAVEEWSEQGAFAGDLEKGFRDDAFRNIAPGLPTIMMRCTCRLANAVTAGEVLAARQVRLKLVKDWLPVLKVCRDNVSPIPSGQKLLYQELEETFLRIISTLPMSDAQKLLQECLTFSTRNVEDCPHLVLAFNTWFRRANGSTNNVDSA